MAESDRIRSFANQLFIVTSEVDCDSKRMNLITAVLVGNAEEVDVEAFVIEA